MAKKIKLCGECAFYKTRGDDTGDCHGTPPEKIGKLNVKDAQDARAHISNGHKEAERGVYTIVRADAEKCDLFKKG